VWGTIHGEEIVVGHALHQLLRVVHADDACAVVVPVANPDGALMGTRQNAAGVDLNRNFPCSTWSSELSPTYWPTTMRRMPERRTMWSSPGAAPGSEPEVQALCALVERVQPAAVIDLHTPLECVLSHHAASEPLAQWIAAGGGLPVREGVEQPTPGDSATWCREAGVAVSVTVETELAPLPQLWQRHEATFTRCIVERIVL
jgi:protein MpaA